MLRMVWEGNNFYLFFLNLKIANKPGIHKFLRIGMPESINDFDADLSIDNVC